MSFAFVCEVGIVKLFVELSSCRYQKNIYAIIVSV